MIANPSNIILISTTPAEEVGRETLSRYDMQFQAAAYAALEILEGTGVVCVFCDFHDDFVVKREKEGASNYHFYQVKTKGKLNHQWSLLEVLGFKKRGQSDDDEALQRIRISFLGKLLAQAVKFGDSCVAVTLLSNVHFEDAVIGLVDEWTAGKNESKASNLLVGKFSEIFAIDPPLHDYEAHDTLGKLSLNPAVSHIAVDRESFVNSARTAIYKYSEVDLNFFEISDLANNLLDMVYQRSKGALADVALMDIEARAGIVLDDLLRVLSISPSAYRALLGGEDDKVIKTASILQRVLKASGASPTMIEYASVQKVAWDMWFRNARHTYSDFDLAFLLQDLDKICRAWRSAGATFDDLQSLIATFLVQGPVAKFQAFTNELVFGGILAALVRSFAK